MTIHLTPYLSSSEATRISPNGVHSGVDITVQNLSDTGYVYIGADDVNPESFGYRLSPGSAWSVELPGTDSLYAIAEEPTYIAVLQTGLEK
jgi:hypothetical protein